MHIIRKYGTIANSKRTLISLGGGYLDILKDFFKIICREMELINPSKEHYNLYDGAYFRNVATRILESAISSTKLRCCGPMGRLTKDTIAYESVAAHTNLVGTITDYALDYIYGNDIMEPHYSRRSIFEAIRMHDLPENITGDTPDNSMRDEMKKIQEDMNYYYNYISLQSDNIVYRADAIQLLEEMQNHSSPEGRIIYLADKLAAILMTLCYDKLGLFPSASFKEPNISPRNEDAMYMCDNVVENNRYLLSEIWTIDFLVQRKLTEFDETGFFTALLVMSTLICHEGKWYDWREADYRI